MESNGNLPLLGQKLNAKAEVGPPIALIRDLDENALFQPESIVRTPSGQTMAITGRSNIVTATDLVDMIMNKLGPELRKIVRDELAKGSP